MENINVEKSALLKAYGETDKNGKALLSNLFGKNIFETKITDKIKTFEDACKALGISEMVGHGLNPDEIAYKKLKIIVKALNEGWIPDWNDGDECKYYPYFEMSGFSYDIYDFDGDYSFVGARLCFKSRELAEYAGKQFVDLYRDFMVIADENAGN